MKRVLKVTRAIIREWPHMPPGVFVMHASMAEHDKVRRWQIGTDIRTSQIVSVNGVAVADVPTPTGELFAGDVVETLNTIYEVI